MPGEPQSGSKLWEALDPEIGESGKDDIIDPPGSLDTFVFGINDDGIVVGVFTDKNGNLHGFKATPKVTAK